jgi:hypothetical protein
VVLRSPESDNENDADFVSPFGVTVKTDDKVGVRRVSLALPVVREKVIVFDNDPEPDND